MAISLSNVDVGDKVEVNWYGGSKQNCIVMLDGEGNRCVVRADDAASGSRKPLYPGKRDIITRGHTLKVFK